MSVPTLIDGRFRIEAQAGAGGMGAVYRAIDEQTGDRVALKVHTASSAGSIERFGREVRLLASVSHPNIVGYIAHGTIEGRQLYVVMEWVDGDDLRARMVDRRLTVEETVRIMLELTAGLEHMHQRGIVHRDLKPSNVMLVGDRAKLIDFGLARRAHDDQRVTETGITMGTPGYMAPEQVRGRRDLDARVDVFALGCVMYECLTDCPAFFGANWLAVQTKILVRPVVPPSALGIELPPSLDRLLQQMLEKEPADRPQDVATIGRVLRALGALDGLDGAVPRQAPPARTPTLVGAPAWRSPAEPELVVVAKSSTRDPVDLAAIEAAVARHGCSVVQLDDGAIVARVERGAGEPAAVRAARCALAIREHAPGWPISIVDNRDERAERALDDATRQLAAEEIAVVFKKAEAAIHLEDSTAAELYDEFSIERGDSGLTLARR